MTLGSTSLFLNPSLTIKGAKGSYAETFARKNGYNFISLGDMAAPIDVEYLSTSSVKLGDKSYYGYLNQEVAVKAPELKGYKLLEGPESVNVTFTAKEQRITFTYYKLVTGVTFNKTDLRIHPDEEHQLKVYIFPQDAYNQEVSFESDNESIVTVDGGGLLTARVPGTTIIRVTTADGGFKDELEVTVVAQPVEGISLNEEALTLNMGETKDLVATIEPETASNKEVSWLSSDEDVAIVDQTGKVIALGKGTATIIVTSEDGGRSAECLLTVLGPDYSGYDEWAEVLETDSKSYSWTIKFNSPIDESTVNNESVYILDKNYRKLDFIEPKVKNFDDYGQIVLENKGTFETEKVYYIIIEDKVSSSKGKRLQAGIKAEFVVNDDFFYVIPF